MLARELTIFRPMIREPLIDYIRHLLSSVNVDHSRIVEQDWGDGWYSVSVAATDLRKPLVIVEVHNQDEALRLEVQDASRTPRAPSMIEDAGALISLTWSSPDAPSWVEELVETFHRAGAPVRLDGAYLSIG